MSTHPAHISQGEEQSSSDSGEEQPPSDSGEEQPPSDSETEDNSKVYADNLIRPMVINREQYEKSIKADGNWKEAITKARAGDLQTLQTLSASASIIPNSDLMRDVCEIHCFHLRKRAPSDFRTSEEDIDPTAKLAIVSAHGLLKLLRAFSADDEQLQTAVTTSWRAIMQWLAFFKKTAILWKTEKSAYLVSTMIGLLEVGSEIHQVKALICTDYDMVHLVIMLWSEGWGFSADHEGVASRTLVNLGALSEGVRGKLIQMVIRQNLGVPDLVAIRMYDRIQEATWYDDIDWIAIEGYASAMVFFRPVANEELGLVEIALNVDEACVDFHQLMSQRLVRAFPPSDSPDHRHACSAMTNFISFSLGTLDRSFGSLMVDQRLLRGGFLETLMQMSAFLDQKHLGALRGLISNALTKLLPPYVAKYSLLNRFKEFYFPGDTEEARVKAMASLVSTEWSMFEGYLLERLAYQALYNENQDKEINRCGNSDCEKEDVNNDFRVCSACKAVRYCSKDCQVADWRRKGHKQKCKETGPGSKLGEEKDDEFLLYCVRRDVIRHLPGLRARALSEYPLKSRFQHVRISPEDLVSDKDSEDSDRDSEDSDKDSEDTDKDSEDTDKEADSPGTSDEEPANAFDGIGVGINYTKLPLQFEVFRLRSLLSQVAAHEPDAAKRITRLISKAEARERQRIIKREGLGISKGRGMGKKEVQSALVRVEYPPWNGRTKISYMEVSLETADAFTVPESQRPTEQVSKRPVGRLRKHQPVEVVAFDKADLYIRNVLQPELSAE